MSTGEIIEGVAMILVIIAWWPYLLGWDTTAYKLSLFVASPIILVTILVRRLARMREGLKYSRHMMDQAEQFRKATQGPLNLEGPPQDKKPRPKQ